MVEKNCVACGKTFESIPTNPHRVVCFNCVKKSWAEIHAEVEDPKTPSVIPHASQNSFNLEADNQLKTQNNPIPEPTSSILPTDIKFERETLKPVGKSLNIYVSGEILRLIPETNRSAYVRNALRYYAKFKNEGKK